MTTIGADDEVAAARAHEYALIASLLLQAPDSDFLNRLGHLSSDDTAIGRAHAALAAAARSADAEDVAREFSALFIGLGRGELLPYGSYYVSGFLFDRPLVKLRADLTELGIERVARQGETEDHIAILCEVMSYLIASGSTDREQPFFDAHMRPWAHRLFEDVENAKSADFYRSVGHLGKIFIEIEIEAFGLRV